MTENSSTFNVLLGEECREYANEINYVFSEVANRIGCSFLIFTTNKTQKIDIFYGNNPQNDFSYHIRFDELSYKNKKINYKCFKDKYLWCPETTINKNDIDLIGGIFRLLTMIDENHIKESKRDNRGIFLVQDLPKERELSSGIPLVEYHIEEIKLILSLQRPSYSFQNKKFSGYSNALLLTHDTDAVNLYSPYEVLFNFIKSIYRLDRVRFEMLKEGVKNLGKDLKGNPLYGFDKWHKYTQNSDIKSAFYLYARTKVNPTVNDCRSSVTSNGFKWDDIKMMRDEGYEFGYHPPINAKYSLDEFIESKSFLEEKIQSPIFGLRHHYWALDWRKPYETFRLHENAGFRYDLSIAWRDKAGFRAGTCMPFKPWDPIRKRALNIYTIPLTIMDGHLMHSDRASIDSKEDLSQSYINEVILNKGVIVFDWHTETICNSFCFENYITVLDEIMNKLLIMDDLLVTTPMNLIKIWHQRSLDFQSKLVQ